MKSLYGKINDAVEAWASEFAEENSLVDAPMLWDLSPSERKVCGTPRSDISPSAAKVFVARWALALDLAEIPADSYPNVGYLMYEGKVSCWDVHLWAVVDKVANNRSRLEYERKRRELHVDL